ncbi:SH3 and cysteine-rich domain-containing protein isoform X2 [Clupea harengus]|uniref:SH3 and cysteine-rich domain-containing protein isoform X2 n=1 Tax=Clupea harengus TaxID=7950 RepID=A0A6P8GB45_CLUHA|nr:SH3 and cysteine-rich domain-containing protein isoform X2 [Clupea harengus]
MLVSDSNELQRLKRSLSFKTKSLRSKSADNFFLRTSGDMKFGSDLCSDVSNSTGQLSACGVTPAIPALAPCPTMPTFMPCLAPIAICPPMFTASQPMVSPTGHIFIEYIFKKPTFCDICNHMIVGTTAKYGLRCKACKMSIHHKCVHGVGTQRCVGKLPKGFRRYNSSPLLVEQFGCIKEVMPIACGSKVDPVYEALRFGTSLAQRAKRTSGSESPQTHSSSGDLAQVPEEAAARSSRAEFTRKHSDNVFTALENGTEPFHMAARKNNSSPVRTQQRQDLLQLNTYVALFRFTPQDGDDLDMRPGDRIVLADDSNDDWWKGVIEDRIGFFPASFAQQVRAGDHVFRCSRTFIGCKEQGQITLKEGQICVGGEDEHSGFIRVTSGKKRGFVPCDVLENI